MEQPLPTHINVIGHKWGLVVDFESAGVDKWRTTGAMAVLLDYLSKSLNFSFTVLKPQEQSGVKAGNYVWTGVMGSLVAKHADMSITPLLMDEIRYDAVIFTYLAFMGNIKILVGRPPDEQSIFGLVSAFDTLICLWYSAMFGFQFLMGSVTRRALEKPVPSPEGKQFWTMFSFILSKGVPRPPVSMAARIQFMMWALFCLIFTNVYSSLLVSSLTAAAPSDRIRILDDFPRFTKVLPALHKGSNEVDYFRLSTREAQREIWRRVLLNENVTQQPLEDLYADPTLDRVEEGVAGIFQEWRMFKVALGKRYRKTRKCRYYITDPYRNVPCALAFRPDINPIFSNEVSKRVQRFFESDLLDNIYSPEKNDYLKCLDSEDKTTVQREFTPTQLHILYGPLIFWAGGMSVAILGFLIEIYIWKFT